MTEDGTWADESDWEVGDEARRVVHRPWSLWWAGPMSVSPRW